ncbi:MAG: hypothetical protein QME90_14830 [Thermodesulfobacteriota bacterium]|nr:hypothetical protein [Thermodesulfobacteriota bacterium]
MGKLREPSRELAKRILTEVGFEDRLAGFSLRERSGPNPITMYSFKEVVSLLNDPHPRLDFSELKTWVRKTMDDQELAEQIAEAIGKGKSDQNISLRIKKLMEERLNQCQKLVGRG